MLSPLPSSTTIPTTRTFAFLTSFQSRKQAKLTSLWAESDSDDDCMILDPQPFTCNPSRKKEIPIVKVGSTKKPTQWVSSSFDDFADLTGNEPSQPKARKLPSQKQKALEKAVGLKRPHAAIQENGQTVLGNKPVTRRPNKDLETSLWSEKYKPITKNDLAVHKKKIEEVEAWVNDHLNRKGLPPVLLLTGPAGVGKTETIRVLAKELKCEVQEWTNPLQDTSDGYMNQEDWRSRSRLDGVSSKSHLAQFQEFLLRANKYNTLDIFGGNTFSRKLILVEEFPNMFYRDAAPFHDILRKYVQVGGSPLVFIVSDSARGESNERLLFPKDLQSHLNITNISFNPIAMTSLTKILTKIATDESLKGSHKFSVPSKSVIESIAMACAGDLRSAVNALQFACLKDTADLAAPSFCKESKGNKKSRAAGKGGKKGLSKTKSFQTDDELASIGGRDTSLFLFRALGKILYCKRDEPDPSASLPALPKHLSQHYRDPLLVNPEEVIEKSNLSGDYFSAYLHQNYPDFFTSIEDIVSASEYISDADFLTVDWASRSALQEYAASLAARGIMHSNSARARHKEGGGGMGWKPLHKPQCYTISKQYRENCESARHLFRSYRSPPVVLQTELIPYLALTNSTLHDTGQISFVQEICRFTNMKSNRYEKLDEKDVDLEDNSEATQQTVVQVDNDTEDAISDSQKNITTSQEQDEEYEIEEFDD